MPVALWSAPRGFLADFDTASFPSRRVLFRSAVEHARFDPPGSDPLRRERSSCKQLERRASRQNPASALNGRSAPAETKRHDKSAPLPDRNLVFRGKPLTRSCNLRRERSSCVIGAKQDAFDQLSFHAILTFRRLVAR